MRIKITPTATTAQHIVINVFSNFEDQEERLHQRDSCSFMIMADKLLEFVSCIAFIISLTEFVCSYSALSNGLDTGLIY
jgi:hypothetical protein